MSSIGSKFCSSAEDVDLDDGDATMNDQPDHSFSNINLMMQEKEQEKHRDELQAAMRVRQQQAEKFEEGARARQQREEANAQLLQQQQQAADASKLQQQEQEKRCLLEQEQEQEKQRLLEQEKQQLLQQRQQQAADALKLQHQEQEKQRLLEQEQEKQQLLQQQQQQTADTLKLQHQEQEKQRLLEQEQEQEQEKQRLQQAFKCQFARFVIQQPNFFETATDEFTQYFDKLAIPLFKDRTGQLTRYCAAANRANELGVKDGDSNELIGDVMFKNTINNFQKWGAEEMKVMLEKHDVFIKSFEQKKAKGAAEYSILFASCGEEEAVIPLNPTERHEWETMNKVLLQRGANKKDRLARKNTISQNKKDMKLKQRRGMTESNSVDNGAKQQLRRSARSSVRSVAGSVAGSVASLESDKKLNLTSDEFFKNLSDKK